MDRGPHHLQGAHTRRLPARTRRALMHAGTAIILVMAAAAVTGSAFAQSATPRGASSATKTDDVGTRLAKGKDGQLKRMVLQADLVTYEHDQDFVIATGSVQVYYDNKTLTADKVTFDRKTKRVTAEGNARIVNPDGTVLTGRSMDVTQDFSQGFIDDLRIDTAERTRLAGARAERADGNVTTLYNGVYTACQTCVRTPEKPPFWQIKAAKVVHNHQERMLYFNDMTLELFGTPIAWVPYFQMPDPSVRRKTGFLPPTYIASTTLGYGAVVPYFWAPRPDWDVTFAPTPLSRQGLLMDVTLRHRTENGTWSVQGVGINQQDSNAFDSKTSQHDWRGAVYSKAKFNINEQWTWGWDGLLMSDRRFATDYKYSTAGSYEASSTAFLTGVGHRNYFDARVYSFQVFGDDDTSKPNNVGRFLNEKQPIGGKIEYSFVHEDPVMGGELGADMNLTALDRKKTDLDLANQVIGPAGEYTRISADVHWRRQVIDQLGEVWKPFLSLRGDVFFNQNTDQSSVPWISDGTVARFMPTAGLEYRYPLLIASSFGSHIIEPIGQIVARTNETHIGDLPNNDANSLVFDDTTLFQVDKFSGWDRVEGGVRANIGAQYTFLSDGGASVSAMFGQSYHLAGTNSFATPEEALLMTAPYLNARPLTGIGSGLDTEQSDYVARVLIDTAGSLRVGSQARFDQSDFALNRLDVQATVASGPFAGSITYAYQKTPDIIYDLMKTALTDSDYEKYKPSRERQEIQTAASVRATENWRLYGSLRYDLVNSFVIGNTVGLGFDNDSFSASLSYIESYDVVTSAEDSLTRNVRDRTVYLRIGLRTLGDTKFKHGFGAQ